MHHNSPDAVVIVAELRSAVHRCAHAAGLSPAGERVS